MERKNQLEPTYAQLQTIFRWFLWKMPREEASAAVHFLKKCATRRQVSEEIKRIYPLYKSHNLTKERCFESEIWRGYRHE